MDRFKARCRLRIISNESDVDYFQWAIRYDDAITTETALRISFEGDRDAQDWSNNYVNFQFYAQGSNDRLRFNDLNNDNTYNQFGANFNQSSSWLVSPESFESGTPFVVGVSDWISEFQGEVRDQCGEAELGDLGELHGPH